MPFVVTDSIFSKEMPGVGSEVAWRAASEFSSETDVDDPSAEAALVAIRNVHWIRVVRERKDQGEKASAGGETTRFQTTRRHHLLSKIRHRRFSIMSAEIRTGHF